jgi:hypothetical protein
LGVFTFFKKTHKKTVQNDDLRTKHPTDKLRHKQTKISNTKSKVSKNETKNIENKLSKVTKTETIKKYGYIN